MKKTFPFLCLVILFAIQGFSQVAMNKDSLLRLLPKAKKDTSTVSLYINIGQQYETDQPEIAKKYYLKARDLSKQINFPNGTMKYISNIVYVMNAQGSYDVSLKLCNEGVLIARKAKDSLNLGRMLFNVGKCHQLKGDFEKAIKYYEEGKNIFFKIKYNNPAVYGMLSGLYSALSQYDKAIEYGEIEVGGFRKSKDLFNLGRSLNNLGQSYYLINKYEEADKKLSEALIIAEKINFEDLKANASLNLSALYLEKGDYDKMKKNIDVALAYFKKYNSEVGVFKSKIYLAYYHTYKKEFSLADQYAKAALKSTYETDFSSARQEIYKLLSIISYGKNEMKLGRDYEREWQKFSDSTTNATITKSAQNLDIKYKTKEKTAQLKLQNAQLQKRRTLNYALGGALLTFLLLGFLYYRTYKQKQQLQDQKINELETEKQLSATQAVLKGEEQERTRIAKDLHDGLGGMLSGIKYSFNTMKGNMIMTADNVNAFDKSMDMLDNSIKEMRRVAHNMMPEALLRFGVDKALRDYCAELTNSGMVKAIYQSSGMEDVMVEQNTAIAIYRIVQELLNNAMKHAEASELLVQLFKENDQLIVNVEDNGKGFDKNLLEQSKGIGWSNIQSRVDYLKGKLDLQSEVDKGTSVHIELSINKG
jgi:two-component system, NarL family, sensor kinase